MENNNALIKKLNKKIDLYLKQGDFDKADKACLELCRLRGQKPADHMPENFLYQLKRKEHENMNIRNIIQTEQIIFQNIYIYIYI